MSSDTQMLRLLKNAKFVKRITMTATSTLVICALIHKKRKGLRNCEAGDTHDCTNEIDNNRTSFDILILKAIISKLVDRDARKTVQGYKSRCTQGR